MQALKIETISAVAPLSFAERIQSFFTRPIPESTLGLTPRTLGNYDQKKNPFCTAFASAWCTTYNTGRIFTNEYIEEWAAKYIKPQWVASLYLIAEWFARDHNLDIKKFIPIGKPEWRVLLDHEFSIAISTNCPKKWWESALRLWRAIGDFWYEEQFDHAVYIHRVAGTDYLENSWYKMTEQWFFNSIVIDIEDMLKRKYIVPNGVLLYKK